MHDKMLKALNEQINAELYSGYMYLSMAAYFDDANLPGFAHWMRLQADEENEHAMKIFDFVLERGGRVQLTAIDTPPFEWDSPVAAFAATLEHEKHVTSLIHGLVDLAAELNDHATSNFLQWFVDEQVEEEASADEVLQQIKMVGDHGAGLLMIDRSLAGRSGGSEE